MEPIEAIAAALEYFEDALIDTVDEVLVPEQCLRLYINGKAYHVTVQELD